MDRQPGTTDPTNVETGAAVPLAIPFWLVRLGALGWRALVIAAFGAVIVTIAWAIGTVTAAVAVAVLASAVVMPIVHRLRARGWGASRAAAVGTALAFGVLILVLAVAAVVLVRYGPDLVAAVQAGLDALRSEQAAGRIAPQIFSAIVDLVSGSRDWLAANVGAIAGNVAALGSILLFGGFTTFYLLANDHHWWDWLTSALDDRRRTSADEIGTAGANRLAEYLQSVTVHAALTGFAVFVLLAILGVPLALPLAVLVFAGGFIPYLGSIVAIGAVLLATLASIGSAGMVLVLALIVLADVAVSRALARRSGATRVNPAIILIALPIGGYVAGFFGLITAVPLTVALMAAGSRLAHDLQQPDEDPTAAPPVVPRWLDLLAGWSWRLLIGLALVAITFAGIAQIPLLALPLIVAAVLAATLAPMVSWLEARGWSRSRAAAVVTAGVSGVIVFLTAVALIVLVTNVADIAAEAGVGAGAADDAVGGLAGLLSGLSDEIGGEIVQAVLAASASVAAFAAIIVVGVVLTFIALRDGRKAWESVTTHLAPWRHEEINAAASRAVSVLGGYMLGTGAVALFGAGTQWLLMVILGIPLALPVFVLSFFGGYIPYFGSMITTFMADLLALSTGDPVTIIVFVAFTLVFNVVQGNVVQPLVFSRAVSLHPAIILLAIPAGSALGGILGMFLVVPFLGVVAATWRSVLEVMGKPPASEDQSASTAIATPPSGPAPDGSAAPAVEPA